MSRHRPVHALVRAVRAAGGTVKTVRGCIEVRLPRCVPPDDRPFLTLVLRYLVTREAPAPTTRRRRSGQQGQT
jgi:hypothetical protein